jgi:hypothetical protein
MSGEWGFGDHPPDEHDERDDVSAAPESGQPPGGRDETRDDRGDGTDPGDDL